MNEKNNSIRVFVDTNVILFAMFSDESPFRKLLLFLAEKHQLIICSDTLTEVSRVLKGRFPNKLAAWDKLLTRMDLELVYTPIDVLAIVAPTIHDEKDRAILASAIIAQPDILVTVDNDFHTDEIREYFDVYTPSEFIQSFGNQQVNE
jgi:putative PIN family toxin of toxin-antitoxin system